jgi:hypothetical protein
LCAAGLNPQTLWSDPCPDQTRWLVGSKSPLTEANSCKQMGPQIKSPWIKTQFLLIWGMINLCTFFLGSPILSSAILRCHKLIIGKCIGFIHVIFIPFFIKRHLCPLSILTSRRFQGCNCNVLDPNISRSQL